ncbi:MAG: peptidylprolyl isomerase [Gemmatimonadales bacterium]
MRTYCGGRTYLRSADSFIVVLVLLGLSLAGCGPSIPRPDTTVIRALEHAPADFSVTLETSQGPIVLDVHRDWAPRGADRFYSLVKQGFFDGQRFFRVRAGYIAQFGINGDPAVARIWKGRAIADDSVRVSNVRGTLAYAMTGPNTRTTQIYINLADNLPLDAQGFAPFAKVSRGMDAVDKLYSGYGESAGGGMRAGNQTPVIEGGNAYLEQNFPRLDYIIRAIVTIPSA